MKSAPGDATMGNLHRKRRKVRHEARRMADEAWSAMERSDVGKAEELIRQALKKRPGDCLLWSDLGLILWKRGEPREAERAFRNALLLRPDHEDAKMNLASLLASRGFYRQALRLEEELAGASPRSEFHRKKAEEYRAAAERRSREGEPGEDPGGEEEC